MVLKLIPSNSKYGNCKLLLLAASMRLAGPLLKLISKNPAGPIPKGFLISKKPAGLILKGFHTYFKGTKQPAGPLLKLISKKPAGPLLKGPAGVRFYL